MSNILKWQSYRWWIEKKKKEERTSWDEKQDKLKAHKGAATFHQALGSAQEEEQHGIGTPGRGGEAGTQAAELAVFRCALAGAIL